MESFPVSNPLTPCLHPESSSSLSFLLDFSLARSVTVHAVHLQMSFAVTFDERSGDEGHEGDGQELSQRPPGEDIIHGGDLREDGARTNADEVVGDQT